MLWQDITSKNFSSWVERSGGVCVLPIGVLEKHGNHLPVGADMFAARAFCERAAQLEPAVVFPYYFLGMIAEGRHHRGTISGSHRLIMAALLEMCDEIARNGFSKILIVSAHGGNTAFLPFFAQEAPRWERDYCVYTCSAWDRIHERREEISRLSGNENLGAHAGLIETSLMMYLRPELVFPEEQDPAESVDLKRSEHLLDQGIYTGFDWYAKFPHDYAGDHAGSSAEIGELICRACSESVAAKIRAVKEDDITPELIREYRPLGRSPR